MTPQTRKSFELEVTLKAMGTAKTRYVQCPVEGRLLEVRAVLNEAIGNDGGDPTPADADVTVTFSRAGSAIAGLSMLFPTAGSAAGQAQLDQPTSETIVKRGEPLAAISAGGGAVTGEAKFTFLLEMV